MLFSRRKTLAGQSICFEAREDGSKLDWEKSQKLPFDISKMDLTDKTLSASVSSGTGSSQPRRASTMRRSSCTRSVHTSCAMELMDAEICVNHVLVNAERERVSVYLKPLRRNEELDELAREHAEAMAKACKTYHSEASQMVSQMEHRPAARLGENVARGASMEYIHHKMSQRKSDYANMMDWRYSEMGMATATGADGKIYLCQLYRG